MDKNPQPRPTPKTLDLEPGTLELYTRKKPETSPTDPPPPTYSPSWWDFHLGLTNGQLEPESSRRSSLTLPQKILSHLKCLTFLISPCCPNLWSRHNSESNSIKFRKSKREKRQSYQISRIIMSSYSNATLDQSVADGGGIVETSLSGNQNIFPSPPSSPDSLDMNIGMGFETPIRPPKTSTGKLSPGSTPDSHITSLFEHLKPKIILQIQQSYDTDANFNLTLLQYRKLIAIGISYFVKIKVNEGPLCVHARIYQYNESDPELKGLQIGKLEGEDIEYF